MTQFQQSLARSAILVSTGYVIAVTLASAVVIFVIFAPTIFPDNGKFGSFYKQADMILPMFVIGIFYTGISALPGYAISLLVAAFKNWHTLQFYVSAGLMTALLAHGLFAVTAVNLLREETFIFFASLTGGAAGGYAYFLWREKMLSVWKV